MIYCFENAFAIAEQWDNRYPTYIISQMHCARSLEPDYMDRELHGSEVGNEL